MKNDDFIDLGPIIELFIRRWKWIAISICTTLTIAILFTLRQPRVYAAEATLAIAPSRTEVQFDPRIQTVADYELGGGTLQVRRAASLVAMVQSNEVVQAVLNDVGDKLQPGERNVEWLRDRVQLETAGDLINVTITYPDPEVATDLANTWVEHFERHVNRVYSSSVSLSTSRISEQVETARISYATAQADLEAYERENPSLLIQQNLDAELALLDSFQQARIASQTMSVDRNQDILNNYYLELAQTETWLANARALREQVSNDTGSTAANLGNALALISLRGNAFGANSNSSELHVGTDGTTISESSSTGIQFDLSGTELEQVSTGDVDALISALETRQDAVQNRIAEFLEQLDSSASVSESTQMDEPIALLAANVASFQAQLEEANASYRELLRSRDNAWETLQILQQKQVEETIASETASSEVRVADRAIVPGEPEGRGLLQNVLLALILGAVVPTGIILIDYWVGAYRTQRSSIDEQNPGHTAPQDDATRERKPGSGNLPETAVS